MSAVTYDEKVNIETDRRIVVEYQDSKYALLSLDRCPAVPGEKPIGYLVYTCVQPECLGRVTSSTYEDAFKKATDLIVAYAKNVV